MNKPYIIKKQLEKIGNQIYLTDGDWKSMPFKAYIYPLWRRKSSAFEPVYTEIGAESREYYLYIGPCNHDIMVLSEAGRIVYDDVSFSFTRRDAVKVNDEIIYFTGILKRIKESEYVEY